MNLIRVFFTAFYLIPVTLLSQVSPGGIGTTHLTAWFTPENLIDGDVTNWETHSSSLFLLNLEDQFAPYPQLESTPTNAVSNYNNTIHFIDNDFTGQNINTVQGLYAQSTPELLSNAYSGDEGSFFCSYYLPTPPSANGHMVLYNRGNDAIQCRNLNLKGRIALGLLPTNSTSASRDWDEDNLPNIISYKGNRSNSSSLKGFNKGFELPTPLIPSQSSGNDGFSVGYSPSIQTSAYNGYLHEIIFFNKDLTDLEMTKVHTYLAIKYGATLSNVNGGNNGDYLATDASVIWDADINAPFHNDVIGIGRDDIEGLLQKQSHSFDDSIRLYIDELQNKNLDNVGNINADISYVLLGHNNAPLCGTEVSNQELINSVNSRIARELKITNTDFNQPFNVDLKLDTCSSIAGINTANIRVLVSEDDDFTNSVAYSENDGILFEVNGGILSIKEISTNLIPVNSTRFLTIAYIDLEYELNQVSGPVCEGENGWVVFELNGSNQETISYTDGVNNYQLQIEDGDTLFLSPNSTTTYSFESIVGLINCCETNDNLIYEQVVNSLPEYVITPFDTKICIGDSIQLEVSGADDYVWSNGIVNGAYYFPTTDQNYSMVASTDEGCEIIFDTLVQVYQLPTVSASSSKEKYCEHEEIMLTSSGADNYNWTPTAQSGIGFTLTPGIYEYEVTGISEFGCENTAVVEFEVFAQPFADFSVTPGSGIAPITVDIEDLSTNATDYLWEYGDGNTSSIPSDHQYNYSNGGFYSLSLTVSNEACADTWSAELNFEDGEISVDLPNIFTPNNDGSNDTYFIKTKNVESMYGTILNRWGNVMFEFSDKNFEWDGGDASEGVYFIEYTAIGINGKEFKGHTYFHLNR
ncbi:MAG: hypothetical protein COA32_02660 [Fluviicola sp.]|nr:MAG: hypothetical protein COA32_02660 [Fluviicola sp.]